MSKWEEQKFGDLYLIPSRNGLTRPSSVRGAGYKFINMGEIFAYNRIGNIETELVQLNEKEKEEMTLQKNDLLFARQSLVFTGAGKCSIMLDLEDVVSFESHIIRVRLNPEIANPVFFYYYFSLPYNSVKTIVQQCAQAGIRGSDLEKIKVPCPHIEIQNQIADVLSAYDDLIDANNRRIELLEQTAQELYKEWFVRFRFPGYENAKFEDGLPKGWELKKIGDIAHVKSGYAFKSEWWVDEGVPVIKIKDIQGNTVDLSDLSHVSVDHAEIAKQFYIDEGDLLIAMTGATIGKMAIVPHSENQMVVNQRVGKFFLGKSPAEKVAFLYITLQQNWVQKLIAMIAGSNAAQPNISPFDLEKIKVVYCEDLVYEYNRRITPFIKQILQLRKQNLNLAAQRDMLLPRLMSGKLEV